MRHGPEMGPLRPTYSNYPGRGADPDPCAGLRGKGAKTGGQAAGTVRECAYAWGTDVGACSLLQMVARIRVGGKGSAHVMVRDAGRAKRHAVRGVEGLRSRPMAGCHASRAMGRAGRSERPPIRFRFEVMRGAAPSHMSPDGRGRPHAESWPHTVAPAKRRRALPDSSCRRMGRLGTPAGAARNDIMQAINRRIPSVLLAGTLRERMPAGWRLLRESIRSCVMPGRARAPAVSAASRTGGRRRSSPLGAGIRTAQFVWQEIIIISTERGLGSRRTSRRRAPAPHSQTLLTQNVSNCTTPLNRKFQTSPQ